jgi:hypothetical protein
MIANSCSNLSEKNVFMKKHQKKTTLWFTKLGIIIWSTCKLILLLCKNLEKRTLTEASSIWKLTQKKSINVSIILLKYLETINQTTDFCEKIESGKIFNKLVLIPPSPLIIRPTKEILTAKTLLEPFAPVLKTSRSNVWPLTCSVYWALTKNTTSMQPKLKNQKTPICWSLVFL